jgi:hypothetical protein
MEVLPARDGGARLHRGPTRVGAAVGPRALDCARCRDGGWPAAWRTQAEGRYPAPPRALPPSLLPSHLRGRDSGGVTAGSRKLK